MLRPSIKGRPAAGGKRATQRQHVSTAQSDGASKFAMAAKSSQLPAASIKAVSAHVEKHAGSASPRIATVADLTNHAAAGKVESFTTDLLSIIHDLKARIPWESESEDVDKKRETAASNLPPLTRKYLHDTLRIYEDKIIKIRTGIRLLSNERDQSYALLSDCRKEISRLNAELRDWKAYVLKMETSAGSGGSNKSKQPSGNNLRQQLEEQCAETKKIQALEQELNWLQLERRELINRLKLATDETIRKSLDESGKIKLLTAELENERMSREKLLQEKSYLESKNHELETDVKFVKDKESEARKEGFYQEKLYNEYGQMLTEKEDMTRQFQQRLAEREYELKTAKDQTRKLDKRVQNLENEIKALESEKSQARGAVRRMTHEADSMQKLADDKSVELVQFHKDLERKERELAGCAERLHQIEEENRFYQNESVRHTDTLQGLRSQQEQALGSLNKASLESDKLRAQVKQLEEQLRSIRNETKLTKEHQDEIVGEKERMRYEMQNYVTKVRDAERRLEQIENEKKSADEKYTSIQEKYRQVAEDLERSERRAFNTDRAIKEKEGETERLKQQLTQLDEQLKQVRDAAQQHRRMQADYEKELEQIRGKYSSTETEKFGVERDLREQRENNNLLTLRNTEIMEQLNKKHDELMKLQVEKESLKERINELQGLSLSSAAASAAAYRQSSNPHPLAIANAQRQQAVRCPVVLGGDSGASKLTTGRLSSLNQPKSFNFASSSSAAPTSVAPLQHAYVPQPSTLPNRESRAPARQQRASLGTKPNWPGSPAMGNDDDELFDSEVVQNDVNRRLFESSMPDS